MVASACNSSIGEAETEALWGSLASQPSLSAEVWVNERFCLNNRVLGA